MNKMTPEEAEARKKAVFDSMSPRYQKRIRKKGYAKWDPFQVPKDPIDIRRDQTRRTTQMLIREFLTACPADEYDNSYARGALDLALGIINNDTHARGMYDFACWYQDLLKKEGHNGLS
ncbi:MAG: hypothetical protein DSY90_05395 [Deltaproteobacteria bacterium]|nr:MAG: hypothetical protein DSY90_05395 [Deltaproteobacteria bacterium]RTZ99947.1 MAG: hypothetical protein DSY89_07580 [Deltaproteobacteria bacterium]